MWRGCAHLPLDTPVSFKYVQVNASSGSLVSWGQDISGGDNMCVLVSPSDEVMSGLQLVLEPADAAGAYMCTCVWSGGGSGGGDRVCAVGGGSLDCCLPRELLAFPPMLPAFLQLSVLITHMLCMHYHHHLTPTHTHADPSHEGPSLSVHLDSAAILPESAARFKEAAAAQQQALFDAAAAAGGEGEAASGAVDSSSTGSGSASGHIDVAAEAAGIAADLGPLTATDTDSTAAAEADAVLSADGFDLVAEAVGGAEGDDDDDDQPQGALGGDPAAEYSDDADAEEGGGDAEQGVVVGSVDQLQLEDAGVELEAEQQEKEDGQQEQVVVGAVIEAPTPDTTSESVQGQGLVEVLGGAVGGTDTGRAAAPTAAATEEGVEEVGGGGLAAGYEDEGSVAAAVRSGLMEAGDDETTAQGRGGGAGGLGGGLVMWCGVIEGRCGVLFVVGSAL